MQIGFNPNISVQEFQTCIQSNPVENEVKAMAFAALATHSQEDLIAGLNTELVERVKVYADQRASQISKFIRALNVLGDQREDLFAGCEVFKKMKEISKVAKNLVLSLEISDDLKAVDSFGEWQAFDDRTLKKLKKWKSFKALCCMQDPLTVLRLAMGALMLKSENEEDQLRKLVDLRHSIRWSLHENGLIDCPGLLSKVQEYSRYSEAVLKLFEEQFPIAETELVRMEREKPAKVELQRKELFNNLKLYQEAFQKLEFDENYEKYQLAKSQAITELEDLATFCNGAELTPHPKVTNESRAWLENKIRVFSK